MNAFGMLRVRLFIKEFYILYHVNVVSILVSVLIRQVGGSGLVLTVVFLGAISSTCAKMDSGSREDN